MSTDPKLVSADLDLEECWRVLERAAASPALKRAARLREFLFYVGSKSLKEGRTGIHEQEIGQAVFGRRDSYDTSQDNIVRVSATELRKRVDAYFASVGREEPIVFDIPRGGYVPSFRLRPAEAAQTLGSPAGAVAAETPVPVPAPVSPWPRLLLGAVSLVAIVLGVACLALWRQNQSLTRRIYVWKDEPALAAFWSHFFASPRETDVVLADTSFMLIEDMTRQSISLSDYLNRSYVAKVQSLTAYGDPGLLASLPARDGGSFGDFRVAQRILALDPGAADVLLNYARNYTADDLKRNNVIMIGSRRSNPWVEVFIDELNFDLEYDRNLDQAFVKNLHPRAGEQAVYVPPANPYATLGYSVIAFVPNPSHTANALLIEGTNSEATNAAGDFITSEQSMQNLLSKLPDKTFPYFELLLRTSRVAGTPLQEEIVAYRTH
jgi:hypothetical protein